jgi:A/G-specific adenine glycosylase
MSKAIAQALLSWYARHARQLPWRVPPAESALRRPDSYAVWVSEVMLQQTQVDTVIPYFQRWMVKFPDVASLAAASEQEVLSAWEGLGYYSRARNLHKAARQVASQHGGQLPAEVSALRALPGIGRYTAGAIASIAFGLDEPALDGNIRRVFARLYDLRQPARSPQGEKLLWEWVRQNLPAGKGGDYHQALMDLGATLCTPRSPTCLLCPLQSACEAYALGVQEQRPVELPRRVVPHVTVTAAVLVRAGLVLIARRPADGLLGGLWEFPGGKQQAGEDLPACLRRELQEELGVSVSVGEPLGVYRHAYTHFRVTLHAFLCNLDSGELQALAHSELRWTAPSDLPSFPMGKIDRQIAQRLMS